jgi:hypothetical protein
MARGGARPGAGRKKNGSNRLTEEAVKKATETGELPLDFLLRMMRDIQLENDKRIDCAKAAAPYLHPRRAPVDSDGKDASLTVIVNKP